MTKLYEKLGVSFDQFKRYRETRNPEDIETAISCIQAALEVTSTMTPEQHPERANHLTASAACFGCRYEATGRTEDLKRAITEVRGALGIIPQDHPNRTAFLNVVGTDLVTYSESASIAETDKPALLQESLTAFLTGWDCTNAPVMDQISSASDAAKLLIYQMPLSSAGLSQAYSLLEAAVHLSTLASPRSLDRDDQQHRLQDLAGLPALTAAVCLEIRHPPVQALKLLEMARCITNGQLLDYRSDISVLSEKLPSLAQTFNLLCLELDSPLPYPNFMI